MSKEFHYGGQAVIEGVMILGQRNMAMAVRRPNGELKLVTKPLPGTFSSGIRKIPLIRGIVILVKTLVIGIRALFESANISLEEEKVEITGIKSWGLLLVSFSFGVALFFLVPVALAHAADPYLHSALLSNVVEGVIRIGIFVLYLGAMNLIPDVRRVFAYHGAEHKVVNAYEHEATMEVVAARGYSTAHYRCGTAFVFTVLILAIIVFALLGHQPMWLRLVSRIVLIPVIAAIGYEITHFGARHADNRAVRVLLAPGLALQAMVTREPDDRQLETAIAALKGVIEADKPEESVSPPEEAVPPAG
ncbi:MAG: DUF1385 domain-containing protein [Chloroflexi bacterium]|nr:DUF1385 domain-containing protein [Chloroflexota bacterium]